MSVPSTHSLIVVEIGDLLGLVLPREVLADLEVAKGDTIVLTPSPDGYLVTRLESEHERQMTVARTVMKRRHDVLRELGK